MAKSESRDLKVRVADGYELAATVYRPEGASPGGPVALIVPATGVKRSYYDRYARFLADSGLTALTFDYRGIGGSRPPSLSGFQATLGDWAEKDISGVIDWICAELRPSKLLAVGHSIGGQLMGLAPSNTRIHAMLAVAAQSGYWGHWKGKRKLFMFFLWHALMPGLTKLFSYFPSKRLGFSEDLPGGVARQWAHWGRHPDYIVDERGKAMREYFHAFTGPILAYSFSDDIDAPHPAVDSLIGCYDRAPKERKHLSPKDLGVPSIGHFGFFREKFQPTLWSETTAWLKQQAAA